MCGAVEAKSGTGLMPRCMYINKTHELIPHELMRRRRSQCRVLLCCMVRVSFG